MSVCVSAPHVLPSVTNVPAFLPTGTLPVRSGRLNVVDPSPTPYVVEVIANNAAYVVLETAAPLASNHPVGAEDQAYGAIIPLGKTHVSADPSPVGVK